jgi:hypothetical protein
MLPAGRYQAGRGGGVLLQKSVQPTFLQIPATAVRWLLGVDHQIESRA